MAPLRRGRRLLDRRLLRASPLGARLVVRALGRPFERVPAVRARRRADADVLRTGGALFPSAARAPRRLRRRDGADLTRSVGRALLPPALAGLGGRDAEELDLGHE